MIPKHINDLIVYNDNQKQQPGDLPKPSGTVPVTKQCEYCGISVTDRREKLRRYPELDGIIHRRCSTCKKIWNPRTKQFNLDERTTPKQLHEIFDRDK